MGIIIALALLLLFAAITAGLIIAIVKKVKYAWGSKHESGKSNKVRRQR